MEKSTPDAVDWPIVGLGNQQLSPECPGKQCPEGRKVFDSGQGQDIQGSRYAGKGPAAGNVTYGAANLAFRSCTQPVWSWGSTVWARVKAR